MYSDIQHDTRQERYAMSSLAERLAEVEVKKPRKTPRNECYPIYGYGDQQDWEALERLRDAGAEWAQIHEEVDSALGIENRISQYKFTRHWKRECACWSDAR